jgi:uncharacterized protein (TIGR03437 family)
MAGTSASLDQRWYGTSVSGLAIDTAGNLFFANGNAVLRLDATTGVLTAVAGNAASGFSGDNGPATSAQLGAPSGVAVDSAGNLYIADDGNSRVRKVSNGVIATVAGNGTAGFSGDNGPAASAELGFVSDVAVDPAGNLYIADPNNYRIRKVSNGVITTVAGGGFSLGDNGPATSAALTEPVGVAVDTAGNLYIADSGAQRIRKVSNGVITTLAGGGTSLGDNGPATSAKLNNPCGVTVDSAGNVYIADTWNNRIRKVSNGVITTVAGNGTAGFSGDNGPATSAQLDDPGGIAVGSTGNLYIADTSNGRIRKVSNGAIATAVGGGTPLGDNGPAASAELWQPQGVAADSAGNVYIADTQNHRVRKVSKGAIATFAGGGTTYGDNGPATSAEMTFPAGLALDAAGNLYIADSWGAVRKVTNGVITTVAGGGTSLGDSGPATSAQLSNPLGVAVDSAGNLYIADSLNFRIRKVSNGVITTVAGTGNMGFSGDNGPATSAQLSRPGGVAVDSAGNLYIADTFNNRIRKVSNGVIATVAGNGGEGYSGDGGPATSAQLNEPSSVAIDASGNLYIADRMSGHIRKVSNGTIATVAGGGAVFGDGGPAACATLTDPWGVAVDSAGNVYVADGESNQIRLLTPTILPGICQNGVVPVYSPVPVIQPGSWVSIYGANLASGATIWNGNFPTSLGGTSVTVDNKLAYLWYVSPTQINLQAPDDTAAGPVNVVVATGTGSASSTVTLAAYGPSFSLLDAKHVAGVIVTPNGSGAYGGGTYDLVGPSGAFSFNTRPVKAGETLILYGVGFGPTSPRVPAGQAFSGTAPTTSPVTITIGGVSASVAFSGITEAGLYQFNLTVPAGTGSGDRALAATVNGVQTPPGPVVTVQ